jgi:SAM-dependent methyltransferase
VANVRPAVSGVRGILSSPTVYELWSRLVGGERGRRSVVRDHVRPRPGARVLDLGCGPGELVEHLGDVRYVGVDVSDRYIARARQAFGDRAEFRVGDATRLDEDLRDFDVVLAFGVLHHLDDQSALRLLSGAKAALGQGGRFVSVDPAAISDDRTAARLLVSWDRGGHVRGPAEYKQLAESTFEQVLCDVRRDLLRFPYTHCVLECNSWAQRQPLAEERG